MKRLILNLFSALTIVGLMTSCGGSEDKSADTKTTEPVEIYTPKAKANPLGIGPVKSEVVLGDFNADLAAEGEAIFTQMCTACHKMDKRHVGPALGEVLDRRNAAWVMNMILNPEEMVKEDPTAKELFAEYLSPMANQNLTEEQARAVIEYFRQYNEAH
jgi:mono/diheme cytochrome c family protein